MTGLRLVAIAAALTLAGCAAHLQPLDYTAFHQHRPRSILVLPPLNRSLAVEATWGWYPTVMRPLAERGYYVFPVGVVSELLRANGVAGAEEAFELSPAKIHEITGADAILYPEIRDYGTKFMLFPRTLVDVSARLVDARTGTKIWEGRGLAYEDTGNNSNDRDACISLCSAMIAQAVNSTRDRAHELAPVASARLFTTRLRELPWGPYDPRVGTVTDLEAP